MASGTIGAPVRRAMSAAPVRNEPILPTGPLTVPSGIWTNTPPAWRTASAARRCWSMPTPPRGRAEPPPAPPPRQQAPDPADEPLPPARSERRRGTAQEPGARRGRERMQDEERVHPAPVSRPDQKVATAWQMVAALNPDPEPEDPEQHQPGHDPGRSVLDGRPRLRLGGGGGRGA